MLPIAVGQSQVCLLILPHRGIGIYTTSGMALYLWEGACSRWRPQGRPGCRIKPSTYPLFRQRLLLVPLLQRLTFEKRKSKQNALAPPLGTSPRLGVPVIRQGFGGPPPRAIHGAGRLNRHPCRFTPQIPVEFRPAWFDGALKIKSRSRSRSRAARFASWLRSAVATKVV